MGQVRDEGEKPIGGVTIKLGGPSPQVLGTTDAAGNFLIPNPPVGTQVLLVDGATASVPGVSYASIPVTVTIQPGAVNTLGFTPHLHAQPVTQPLPVAPAVATPITSPTVPDFQVTIPAGVSIFGWDGQPNTQIGVRAVPLDRLAIPPLPSGVETNVVYMFSFGKVGGGTPTAPIPVTAPNTLGAYPGQQVELWFFNEAPDGTAPNAWQMFGLGTVSSDGKLIVSNPGVGIPRFCCGAIVPRRPPSPPNNPPPENAPEPSPEQCPTCGGPIDLASGIVWYTATDLTLKGRLPISVTRHYRTLDPTVGPFGVGGRHRYEVFVRAVTSDLVLLLTPENLRPRFLRQPDGTYLNTDYPAYRGARLTGNPDETTTLRYKDGMVWTFNSAGWLIRQADRHGNTVLILRDSQNRVTSVADPAGRTLTFSYSGSDLKVQQVTDPLGRRMSYTYDGSSRLTSVTGPAGGLTRYTYDAGGRLATITDPRGIVTERNTYDSNGRVIQQVQADGGTFQIAYQVVAGTVAGVTVTDPNGNRRGYRLSAGRFLSETTDALGQTTRTPRAPGSNLIESHTDALGRESRFTYDGNGNLASITDASGHVRSFTSDPTSNRLLATSDPLGQVTSYGYDIKGNLTGITDPLGHSISITYNQFGQPVSTTDPLGHTTTLEYDSVGNLTATIDPLGHRTERVYDAVSRLIALKASIGAVTRFVYDALDRVIAITDALGGSTTFTYDGSGNLLTVTDARGNTTAHTYDGRNRLISRTDRLGRTESYTYDLSGNLRTFTDRKGQSTTFTYDAVNRRVKAEYADGTTSTFTYNVLGRLAQIDDTADPHRPIVMEYDPLDRLVSETTALGTVSYEYDTLGRRTLMTVSGQAPVAYTYDAASRLRTITQAPLAPVNIQYDALDRRTRLTLPNGVSTEYQYDAASQLTALIYRNALGMLGDLQYTYDTAGSRTALGGSFAHSLLADSVLSAAYDAANRQLTFGSKTMTFDANGNLTTLTEGTATTLLTWDARNRLIALGGATTASFTYDGVGRRVAKTVAGGTVLSHYDVADTVREVHGGVEVSYLRTLGLDEALVRAGTEFLLADGLGSLIAVTDSGGALTASLEYEPFGRLAATGVPPGLPFRFTGREDDGTGLYYYRARYYSPSLARFISEDPLGLAAELTPHLYAYVGNSPLTFIDPLGLARIPYPDMVELVRRNNRSGLSNGLILCLAWNESNHDPTRRHGSKTETGLMAVSRGAASRVGFDHTKLGDPALNIQAGSAYLALRVQEQKGDLTRGLQGYGTGSAYPVGRILECEECLRDLPEEGKKCPTSAQECLDKVHK